MGKREIYPTINTDNLPPNIRNHLIELIEKMDFFNLPEKLYSDQGFDFIYTTVIIDGHAVTDIDASSNPSVDQQNFKILVKHITGIYELQNKK